MRVFLNSSGGGRGFDGGMWRMNRVPLFIRTQGQEGAPYPILARFEFLGVGRTFVGFEFGYGVGLGFQCSIGSKESYRNFGRFDP